MNLQLALYKHLRRLLWVYRILLLVVLVTCIYIAYANPQTLFGLRDPWFVLLIFAAIVMQYGLFVINKSISPEIKE